MGRLQPTVVMPPNTVRRADRAKKAKETINKTIPDLLRSSPRARQGVHKALLIADPHSTSTPIQHASNQQIGIRLRHTDTLTAARQLTQFSRRASLAADPSAAPTNGRAHPNVCVLNMASPLRAGGGFLDGATSQEEFLCMRTTLFPSLWDDFYRLPEVGGVLTSDVLVFRDSTPEAEELQKRERFFVDVISAAMLRFPETNTSSRQAHREGEEETPACSCGVSYCDKDRELVAQKMRGVLRMAQNQGAEKLVLGAWGCGAYGNPVAEVAKIWKRVLCGTHRRSENWSGIKEIVFAINDRAMLKEFERCFADVLAATGETISPPPEVEQAASPWDKTSDLVTELVSKIQETELQLDQITNPRSKARLRDVLANLNKQLVEAGSEASPDNEVLLEEEQSDDDEEADSHHHNIPTSDGEENSYYNYDSDDLDSSACSSSSPTTSSLYEFRFRAHSDPDRRDFSRRESLGSGMVKGLTLARGEGARHVESREHDDEFDVDHAQLDMSSGWFAGSINGLSALLNKPRRGEASPVLGPQEKGRDVDVEIGEVVALDLEGYLRRYSTNE